MYAFKYLGYSSTLIKLAITYFFIIFSTNKLAQAYPKVVLNKVFQLESTEKLEYLYYNVVSDLHQYELFRIQESPPFYALTVESSQKQTPIAERGTKLLFVGDGKIFHKAKTVGSGRK